MVHFFIGTKAQFIKMVPVMVEMTDRGLPFRYVDSGQHAAFTRSLRQAFGVREPDASLREGGGDIVSVTSAMGWYLQCLWKSTFQRRWLRETIFPGGGVCLIHGDTLSTLLGMQLARRAGLKVAHVEAGLRSYRIWDPFPEELIRIRCMRKSHVLFTPSEQATRNLQAMNVAGRIVEAGGNTVADALRLASRRPASVKIPDESFALATCHRLETITRKDRLERVVSLMNRVAEDLPVVFVTHKPTRRYLERFDLTRTLHAGVTQMDMLDYWDFVAMEKAARLVLSDGGSIQEECAYLGKPCLIIRKTTERPDGVGTNATLWGYDSAVAERFLKETLSAAPAEVDELPRPSARIVDVLLDMGYATCG